MRPTTPKRISRLSIFACSSLILLSFILVDWASSAEPKASLRAGAAKVDITPRLGVSLDGPISKNGPVAGVHDRLHARAVVLDDGLTRLAIVICGPCIIGRDVMNPAIMPGNNIALKVPQNTSGESP
jgi:hypothetical protein